LTSTELVKLKIYTESYVETEKVPENLEE